MLGDVITAIVAGSSAGGVDYNVGALFGAGQFVASFVVGQCVFKSEEEIVFEKGIIYRDVGFYILSTFIMIGFAFQGDIYYYSAIIMLSAYVIYVLITVLSEKICASQNSYAELDSPVSPVSPRSPNSPISPQKQFELSNMKSDQHTIPIFIFKVCVFYY